LGDNLALLGVGVIALVAVGIALYSSTASAATLNSWPSSQFAGGGPAGVPTVGEYVLLQDAQTGKNLVIQVTGLDGSGGGSGTVYYAPPSAPESAGDTVAFAAASVLSSNSSSAVLQGLL
jgi:hypothetical protein